MAAFSRDFVRGVAMVLQGECLKANAFVSHGDSLGALRERMVRRFIRDETPEKYRVETGFIQGASTSLQCDILVHESAKFAPLYRWEDFVVVDSDAARAVIEIKSDLDKERFGHLLKVHESVVRLAPSYPQQPIPTFGYGLSGSTFDFFVGYIAAAMKANCIGEIVPDAPSCRNLPHCIAVHDRQYIGCRLAGRFNSKTMAYCAVDFTRGREREAFVGVETGYFLRFYDWVIGSPREVMHGPEMSRWFNSLPVDDEAKVWITAEGEVGHGALSKDGS